LAITSNVILLDIVWARSKERKMISATSRGSDGNSGGRSVLTDIIVLACLAAAILAALWSLKTTYLGMNLILKDSAGALVFSSIIQLWLLGVSLALGRVLALRFLDQHARNTAMFTTFLWLSFAITLLISMFFSYVNYLNNTFGSGQDELSDRGTATALVQRIMPDLSEAVEGEKRTSVDGFLRRSDISGWKIEMDKLLKAAADSETRDVVAKATAETVRLADAKRATDDQTRRDAEAARATMPKMIAEQNEKRVKVELLEKQLRETEAKKAEQVDKRKTAEKLRDNELKSDKSVVGKKGQGKNYNDFKAQAEEALRQERALGLQVVNLTRDLQAPKRELEEVGTRIKTAEGTISAAAQLDAANTAVGQPTSRPEKASGDATGLEGALREFASDPQQSTYIKVVDFCNSIRTAILSIPASPQSNNIRELATRVACVRTDVAASMKARTEEAAQFAAFATACNTTSGNEVLKDTLKTKAQDERADAGRSDRLLRRAQDYTQQCLSSAPKITPALRQQLQLSLNGFVESNDIGTDQLKLALLGFGRAPLHAFLSATFAFLQDFFVLIAGIGAEYVRRRAQMDEVAPDRTPFDGVVRKHDAPFVAACKIILQLARQEPGSPVTYLVEMNSPEWSEQEALHGPNMMMVLKSLSAKYKATLVSLKGETAYRIDRYGYQELLDILADAMRASANQAAAAPPPANQSEAPGVSSVSPDAPSAARPRTRQQILAEMLGRSDQVRPAQPPVGSASVGGSMSFAKAQQTRTPDDVSSVRAPGKARRSGEEVRSSSPSRQELLDRLLHGSPTKDFK
jgi:hypothetical protein